MAGEELHVLQGKMDNGRNEKHLGGNGCAGGLEPVENHALMGGMLVNQDQLPTALHDDIGTESLPQNPVLGNGRTWCILNGNFFRIIILLPRRCVINRFRRMKGSGGRRGVSEQGIGSRG